MLSKIAKRQKMRPNFELYLRKTYSIIRLLTDTYAGYQFLT